jgi:hypothetical protein
LEVGRVDGSFFASSEDGDDTAERGGLLEEWEKVGDESSARIICQARGKMEVL